MPWTATLEELKLCNIIFLNLLRLFRSLKRAIIDWLCPNVIHWFNISCPQGSCLGPFLWRIFMNRLLKKLLRAGVIHVAFADDLLILARHNLEDNGNQVL